MNATDGKTNEQLQASAALARRNIERLKTQAPLPPVQWDRHRGCIGAGHRARSLEKHLERSPLRAKDNATLVQTLGGAGAFVKSRIN